ncbi:hypothetical protein SAMN05421779_10331 [Insolitispirillum peregrinum]|uniref:SGNH hydrolase-type esterase domain-containing protein n=2 Tax=Insolitispirillum peregrinum TaxID=80876 RepID=A0A1N7L160_9PROT|nr:hypothetical protein SAMN05421779_10331 [Insolitispirillum peregrinum]
MLTRALSSLGLMCIGLVLACLAGEGLVRLATADQRNYMVEMWRYATLLKRESANPAVGHEHVPNSSARLQGVDVSINSLGMRGPEPDLSDPKRRNIVIIGDSMAFGWGVEEARTLRGQLAQALGGTVNVMTTGVGNMNMQQIVAHWLDYSPKIAADTVIVLTTARATEVQEQERAGWLVQHSQLYALMVSFSKMLTPGQPGQQSLLAFYQKAWGDGPGRTGMVRALDALRADQQQRGYRVIVALMPETHEFHPYPFGFITEVMQTETTARGWPFIDLLPELADRPARSYWAMDEDPHPNGDALGRVARRLLPSLTTPAAQ